MAKSSKPEKPDKSQQELRTALEQRLNLLKPSLQQGIDEYRQALEDGLFEDKEGEPTDSGEKRKEEMQKRLSTLFDRAENIKAKLDSGEELPQAQKEISTTYTHPDGKKETITLDFETKLQEFTSFYQTTNLDLPLDFEDTAREIWNNNQGDIEQAIAESGFDDMLIIPPTTDLAELAEKMKMENGYYFYQVKEDFSNVQSLKVDKSRIILFHHLDSLPEITQKTGLNTHLNITGADAQKLYQANPEKYLGTLEDAIVLERKYFEDTGGKHLSDYNNKSAQWLPGSSVGARLGDSYWDPDYRRLYVSARGLTHRASALGVRPSRCFF